MQAYSEARRPEIRSLHQGNFLRYRSLLCLICQNSCSIGQEVSGLACSHAFHVECIEGWLEQVILISNTIRAQTAAGLLMSTSSLIWGSKIDARGSRSRGTLRVTANLLSTSSPKHQRARLKRHLLLARLRRLKR